MMSVKLKFGFKSILSAFCNNYIIAVNHKKPERAPVSNIYIFIKTAGLFQAVLLKATLQAHHVFALLEGDVYRDVGVGQFIQVGL